jgi:F-type H+-transporting ATPase subunit epsilon
MANAKGAMRLQVLQPERVVLDRMVRKIVADGANGSFGMLPRHIDFVEPLVHGILSLITDKDEDELFIAVDEGVLVKCGNEVLVSVRHAVVGTELGMLEQTVRERFERVDEREHAMRTALAKLEADVVRRFIENQ